MNSIPCPSPQVGYVSRPPWPMSPDIFEATVKMMESGQIDPFPVITDHIELNEIVDKGFEALLNDKSQSKILVKLSGDK